MHQRVPRQPQTQDHRALPRTLLQSNGGSATSALAPKASSMLIRKAIPGPSQTRRHRRRHPNPGAPGPFLRGRTWHNLKFLFQPTKPSCPSSMGSEYCQGPPNPTVPIITVTTPNHSSLIDPRTETSSMGDTGSPFNRQATVKRAGLLRPPPQYCSTVPSPTQRRAPSPEQGRKALGIVIGFCEHQPSNFPKFEEGVLLGKLDERLRRNCG